MTSFNAPFQGFIINVLALPFWNRLGLQILCKFHRLVNKIPKEDNREGEGNTSTLIELKKQCWEDGWISNRMETRRIGYGHVRIRKRRRGRKGWWRRRSRRRKRRRSRKIRKRKQRKADSTEACVSLLESAKNKYRWEEEEAQGKRATR